MAKLNKQLAQAAQDSKDAFGVLPGGLYLAKLKDVDTTKSGPAGPYWNWQYETVEIGDQPGGRFLWERTSLSEKAIGRLGRVFEAFGATTDTDTDDLIGGLVCLEVRIGTIQKGDRAGERTNEIVNVLSADSHPQYDEYADANGAKAGADPDDF